MAKMVTDSEDLESWARGELEGRSDDERVQWIIDLTRENPEVVAEISLFGAHGIATTMEQSTVLRQSPLYINLLLAVESLKNAMKGRDGNEIVAAHARLQMIKLEIDKVHGAELDDVFE